MLIYGNDSIISYLFFSLYTTWYIYYYLILVVFTYFSITYQLNRENSLLNFKNNYGRNLNKLMNQYFPLVTCLYFN